MYFVWALPIIVVVALMASGRVRSIGAGLWGAGAAALIAVTVAPVPLSAVALLVSSVKGLWLSALVAIVILAGLFFREIVSEGSGPSGPATGDNRARRRGVFSACFLTGPFAESATGFGVGQVATVGALRNAGLEPQHIVLLGLFSQTLVSWGAMANGTVVGARLAGLSTIDLGVHSALLCVPLLLAWLALFWRMAAQAGVAGTRSDVLQETCWVLLVGALLIAANGFLGAEIAGMAALGPVLMLRFWTDEAPTRERWRSALRVGLPYAALIGGLVATRGIPPLNRELGRVAAIQPFGDGPVWQPLLHPATWLVGVGAATATLTRRVQQISPAVSRAWTSGRKAVLTIGIYLVVARIMADSGAAAALAEGLKRLLGSAAVLATPMLGGMLGFLTGSSNASNGLLMPSQASLADAQVSTAWVAALQNTAAASLTMLSPARVAMGCALVNRLDLERTIYGRAWPLGVAAIAVLTGAAALLLALP